MSGIEHWKLHYTSTHAMQRILITIILWLGSILFGSLVSADSHRSLNIAELERQIHRHLNLERHRYGLPGLDTDKRLVVIARNHSRDMAKHHFFSHVNLQGEDSSDRAERQGWHKKKQIDRETFASGVSENIYMTHLYDEVVTTLRNGIPVKRKYRWKPLGQIVESIVQGWMNSSSHKKNILSPQHDRQGVGVAISGNEIYVTEDLF